MKKFLNTLYVTTQGSYLRKEGETIVVSVDRETVLRVPVHALDGVVCFGNVMCSPHVMNHCAQNNVLLSFMSETGKFLARVHGPVCGNVLLRRQQYRSADNSDVCTSIGRSIIGAKLSNCRSVLQRSVRDHGESEQLSTVIMRLGAAMRKAANGSEVNSLRGIEGDGSKAYFSVFDEMITNQKNTFLFRGRNRRPPLDNVNALMSFIYTLLVHDCTAALEGVGLDPQVGFFHRDKSGRPSLALDLMEEFRSFFADRLTLTLINKRQVHGNGFVRRESGAVEMTEQTRKTVLVAYQKRKQEEVKHPFLGDTAPFGVCMHLQALLLARYLRGDLDGYPPFIHK